jgi:hypothetical protein
MATYKCSECDKEERISVQTIISKKGVMVCREAFCKKCKVYMETTDKFNGFGKALMSRGKALPSSRSRNAQPSGRIGDDE